MRPNPIADAIEFLTGSSPVLCLHLLVAASLIIAGINLSRDPGQRNIKDISIFMLRFFIGCMWWQQSLWKLPPTYTDHADGSGGLRYWVDRMVDGAAFQLQSDFVHYVVQPYFLAFAPIVYATEVFIGASLMTGTAVRLSGLARRCHGHQLVARPLSQPRRMAMDLFFPHRHPVDVRPSKGRTKPGRGCSHRPLLGEGDGEK